MKRLRTSTLIGFTVGAMAWVLGWDLPFLLRLGTRMFPDENLQALFLLLLAPAGCVAFIVIGVSMQDPHLPGWIVATAVTTLPIAVNGIYVAGLVRCVAWGRTRTRPLSLSLMIGPAAYGSLVLAVFVLMCFRP